MEKDLRARAVAIRLQKFRALVLCLTFLCFALNSISAHAQQSGRGGNKRGYSSKATSRSSQSYVVTSRTVIAGAPLFGAAPSGKPTDITTPDGRTVAVSPLGFFSAGKKLPKVRYQLALPKGKSLKDVGTVVIAIPPAGTAPLFLPEACAKRGMASAAITGATSNNWFHLASLASAVSDDLQSSNENLRFIFVGFSAGGFGAHIAEMIAGDDCAGLILVGSCPITGGLPQTANLPVVSLVGASDFNLSPAKKAVEQYRSLGMNVKLLTHPGGHTWAKASDQVDALDALGPLPKRTPTGGGNGPSLIKAGQERLLIEMLGKSEEEYRRVLGKPTSVDRIEGSRRLIGLNYTWGKPPKTYIGAQWNDGVHVFLNLPAPGDWKSGLKKYGLVPSSAPPVEEYNGEVKGHTLKGVSGLPPGEWECTWSEGHLLISRDAPENEPSKRANKPDLPSPGSLPSASAPGVSASSPIKLDPWISGHFDGGKGSMRTTPGGEIAIRVDKAGRNPWSNQAYRASGEIEDGKTYSVRFKAKADRVRTLRVMANEGQTPFGGRGMKVTEVQLGTEYEEFEFTFVAKNAAGKRVRPVAIELGGAFGPGLITVKDVSVTRVP